VGEDIENFRFNTAISALMVIVNQLAKNKVQHRRSIELLALMLAPFAPFVTEEIWSSLGFKESIHLETWPSYDEKYLESELATIVVQVNGKVRANLEMSKNSTQEEAEKLARENANVKKFLADSEVKKVIFVPNKLLNFVV
jgi:leucyl-tRNA synthetase